MAEPTSPPARVAVLRFGAVGDVVLTTGALAALTGAWPQATLAYVTKARFAPLLAAQPGIAEVLALDDHEGLASLRRRLLTFAPDLVLDLHDKLRSALLGMSLPARRVVWRKRPRWIGLAVRLGLRTYQPRTLLATRFHRAVEEAVGHELAPEPLRLLIAPGWRDAARARLSEAGLDQSASLIGMAPGAMWPTKQWPAEHFGALARRCLAEGWQVVLTGSRAEAPLTAAVAAAAPGTIDLGGWGDLAELCGLIGCCSAFVANDSGPMHIARAVGVPTLAIFGSTSPAQFDFGGHRVLDARLACAPCSLYGRRRCPLGHLDCLRSLSPELAFTALAPLVAGARPGPVLG